MSLDAIKDLIPDFARDVRLNLSSLSREESLTEPQRLGLVLACAIAARNPRLLAAAEVEAKDKLEPAAIDAARAAAAIMGMNNVYYRFVHLVSNSAYKTMPARLRMNVLANPGVPKVDFELWSLAVSAINGCGTCLDSHEKALAEAGVPAATIQSAVRVAAVIQSAAIALEAAGIR
jgi:lipoyl-dependent peroxiredoxin subunit D